MDLESVDKGDHSSLLPSSAATSSIMTKETATNQQASCLSPVPTSGRNLPCGDMNLWQEAARRLTNVLDKVDPNTDLLTYKELFLMTKDLLSIRNKNWQEWLTVQVLQYYFILLRPRFMDYLFATVGATQTICQGAEISLYTAFGLLKRVTTINRKAFFPIFVGNNHFVLLVADVSNKHYYMVNSLKRNPHDINEETANAVKAILKFLDEQVVDRPTDPWKGGENKVDFFDSTGCQCGPAIVNAVLKEVTDYDVRASVTHEDFGRTRIRMLADLMAQKIHPLDQPVVEEYTRHAAIRFNNDYEAAKAAKKWITHQREIEEIVRLSEQASDGLQESYSHAAIHLIDLNNYRLKLDKIFSSNPQATSKVATSRGVPPTTKTSSPTPSIIGEVKKGLKYVTPIKKVNIPVSESASPGPVIINEVKKEVTRNREATTTSKSTSSISVVDLSEGDASSQRTRTSDTTAATKTKSTTQATKSTMDSISLTQSTPALQEPAPSTSSDEEESPMQKKRRKIDLDSDEFSALTSTEKQKIKKAYEGLNIEQNIKRWNTVNKEGEKAKKNPTKYPWCKLCGPIERGSIKLHFARMRIHPDGRPDTLPKKSKNHGMINPTIPLNAEGVKLLEEIYICNGPEDQIPDRIKV